MDKWAQDITRLAYAWQVKPCSTNLLNITLQTAQQALKAPTKSSKAARNDTKKHR